MITTYYGKNRYLALTDIKRRTTHTSEFNLTELNAPDIHTLAEIVNTSPLMGIRRFIIVHSLDNLINEKQLIGVLENKRETSHVIFIIPEYGKKREKLRAYLNKFQVIKIDLFDEKQARTYAKNIGGTLGIDFGKDNDLVDYFIFLVGTAPEAIDIELETLKNTPFHHLIMQGKLAPMSLNHQILNEQINRRTDQNLYSLVERLYIGQLGTALSQIGDFIFENPSVNIHSLLNFLIADLKAGIMVKACLEQKISIHTLPLSSYRIKYIRKKVGRYSLDVLIKFFCALNEIVYCQVRKGNDPIPFLYACIHQFRGEIAYE